MRIAFVTPELAPYTPGGAGAAISVIARLLAGRDEVAVFVVGATPQPVDEDFEVVWVEAEGPDPFVTRSEAAARVLGSAEAFDWVEFVDFDALGFASLVNRQASNLENSRVAVRLHGPSDLMFEAIGSVPEELRVVIAREAEVFRMADLVVASSEAMAHLARERYRLNPDRVVVGALPVEPLPKAQLVPSHQPEIVCVGRLGEVKGTHDLLEEMIPVLSSRPDLRIRFIGQDGWSVAAKRPMREWLESMVPEESRQQVTFEGRVPLSEFPSRLSTAWIAVFPSRFEGYCLAADEVRSLGLPVVVRDIAGFRDRMGPSTGALVVANRPGALAEGVMRLVDDPALRSRLAASPPPAVGDPTSVYQASFPSPRHPRSQAGLATAAVKRIEAMAPAIASSWLRRAAKTVLQVMPIPFARVLVRVLPRGLKDGFRGVASWREEEARRLQAGARSEMLARIEKGEFSDLEVPEVTVVIPCFNQGEFLLDAIHSVFAQDFDSWEIVVVDDGSTDPETIATIDSLGWPRVRVVRQENRGLSAARNAGMAIGKGRFLVPLDADDALVPEFLSATVSALDSDPEAAFAHCWAILFGDIDRVWISRPYNAYQILMSNSIIGCVLLRKEAWEAAGGYDESMRNGNEDWELWVRLLELGWGQVEVRRPLFKYRKHGLSMSVETESRFEQGRLEVQARHSRLYEPDNLDALKAAHYPLISVIGPLSDVFSDPRIQIVPCSDPVEGIRSAHGRFLTWSSGANPAALIGAAESLAADARLAGVPCGNGNLWRRWYLMDRGSGHDAPDPIGDPLEGIRLDDWAITSEVLEIGLPVMRQSPEGDSPEEL